MSSGSYVYAVFGGSVLATSLSQTLTADATIGSTFAQTVTSDTTIGSTFTGIITANATIGSTFSNILTADATIGSTFTQNVTADAEIQARMFLTSDATIGLSSTDTLTANATITSPGLSIFLIDKSDGETLQADELRDGHSIGLNNMIQWFHNDTGSAQQNNFVKDSFDSDNAFRAKYMWYNSGSWQCADMGSMFFVLIECGSITAKSDFNINNCNIQQYDVGSYILFGPLSESLGSSRARVMKTLFFGTTGQDARATSTYIYQLGSIKVMNDSFEDVGKRAYFIELSGDISGNFSSVKWDYVGSFESSAGSIWSWSKIIHVNNSANATFQGVWQIPHGTTVHTATNTSSDETGLDLISDVDIDTGSTLLRINMNESGAGTESASGSVQAYMLTVGSVIFNANGGAGYTTKGSTLIDFQTDKSIPPLGSVDTSDLLEFNECWVQPNPLTVDISGSVDTVIYRWLGSKHSDTIEQVRTSVDGGSEFIHIQQGVLGSVLANPTGSLIFKYGIIRTGSEVDDYTDTYGVYYG